MDLKALKREAEKKLGKGIVFGEGPSNAKVMIAAEGPGRNEIKLKKPFVGRAGKFLDKILKENSIDRKKIYIASVLKTLPDKITKKEVEKQKPFLQKQIGIIKPKIIILFGNLALKAVLNMKSVTKHHGNIIKKEEITCIPMFHPAAAMRFPEIKKMFRQDFKKYRNLLKNNL